MTRSVRAPKRPPTHPGELLDAEVFPALGLSISAAARALGVTRQTLHRIIAGKGPVTPEMAVLLGKLCGNGPMLWLRMQAEHDIWHAERDMQAAIARVPDPKALAGIARSAAAAKSMTRQKSDRYGAK